jgi:pyrimidine-nucleoside phosphorylase
MVADVGTAIVGQTPALVPADKRLYALRDVTATVESVPLISASVMSKKLAEGARAVVLDVKCGNGAFMPSPDEAFALARALVDIGTRAGVRTVALVTAMDVPLGRAVGNAIEITECVDALRGHGSPDLAEVLTALAERMLVVSGRYDAAGAAAAVTHAITSGAALDRLRAMVARQGGDVTALDDAARLPSARHRAAVASPQSGFVTALHAGLIGRASMRLGAGRDRADAPIDHGAGVWLTRRPGEAVRAGEPVLELLYNDDAHLAEAMTLARRAIAVGDEPPPAAPLVLGVVG